MHEEGQLAVRYGFEQRPDIWRKGLWHGRIVDPHRFQRALNGGVRAQNVPSAVAVRPKISGDFNVKQTCSFIAPAIRGSGRSEEHTSELQSLMRISYAVFCLKKKKTTKIS